jgi:hypothetical protein
MLFCQTAAPVGWTKLTANNDKTIRITSGTVGSGGTTGFNTVFGARTIDIAHMPSHSHGVNDPGHFHTYYRAISPPNGLGTSGTSNSTIQNTSSTFTGITIQNTGSGTAMDFNVLYIDVIQAQKN